MIKYIAQGIDFDIDIWETNEQEFVKWFLLQWKFQLDIETQLADTTIDFRIRTIQFGECTGSVLGPKDQYVLEWDLLSHETKLIIRSALMSKNRLKIIQNAAFEYQVFLNYGIVMENVYDTMLQENLIYSGYDVYDDDEGASFYSLEAIERRRLHVDLDKTYQTMFGPEFALTKGHIVYAAQDVTDLDIIMDLQVEELAKLHDFDPNGVPIDFGPEGKTYKNHLPTLENTVVLAYSDMMWQGVKIDQKKWIENAEMAQPLVDKAAETLNDYLKPDGDIKLRDKAIELGYIPQEDKILINWKSPEHKRILIGIAFPDIPGSTKPILKKYHKDNPQIWDTLMGECIAEMIEGNFEVFQNLLVTHMRDDLISLGYLVEAQTILINWGAWQQTLPLLKAIKPSLTSVDEEAMNKLEHPIAFSLLEYRKARMLIGTFGMKFLDQIDHDGKVRTRFKQILATGRVSSSKPNIQQIPLVADEQERPEIVNRYRHCFLPDPGYVFVGSDYSSQELVVIASISKDEVWIDALKNGYDLHSICAALVFGKKWDEGAVEGCKFVTSKQKCKCPKHKTMRSGVKTINFGLAYGMSHIKLSATLKIAVREAMNLIDQYFSAFPKIGGTLRQLGNYAVRHGHIMTIKPFYRRRWYSMWDKVRSKVEAHIKEIQHDPILGSIERTGKNHPIQGTSADMIKLATCMIREYINEHDLRHKVKLVIQAHDENVTMVVKEFAEEWAPIQTRIMEEAAKIIIPSGLLKADTSIMERWEK